MPKVAPLTPSQRRALFAEMRTSARALGEDAESYRRRIMAEELGAGHLADVSRGAGFDRLMARALADRGDYARAVGYAQGSARRIRHLVVDAAKKIVAAKDGFRGSVYDYLAGVMRQSGMIPASTPRSWCDRLAGDSGWADFTDQQLKRLLMMLNTHIRRAAK